MIKKAKDCCDKYGVYFNRFYTQGHYGETKKTMEESLKNALKYKIPHPLDRGAKVIPYPGTELYEIAKKEGVGGKIEFLKMDCEKMSFPNNSFDVIFDGGTFSSLDLNKVFPELNRILKPGGVLIGIETFGHNPLANLKRSFNKLFGKRTSWAAEHIFQEKDIKEARKYFSGIETYFFHPVSFITFPFLSFPGGKTLLRLFEFFDKALLIFPFLRKLL